MYFRLRYKNEINIAIESGDEIVSALQMIPYPMTFCGDTVQTSYISGACTHPDFRGNGVMRELLSQAFAKMLRNGMYFSTLIPAEPWLFDYYTRMGYASVFQYSYNHNSILTSTPVTSLPNFFHVSSFTILKPTVSKIFKVSPLLTSKESYNSFIPFFLASSHNKVKTSLE